MSKSSQSRAKAKARNKTSAKAKAVKSDAKTKKQLAAETAPLEAPESESTTPMKSILHRWNVWLAVIFLLQAAAILLFGTTHDVGVTVSGLAQNSLTSTASHVVLTAAAHPLFDLNIGYLIALFLLTAASGHIIAASVYRPRYEAELQQGLNRMRWIEYAVSSSLMLVVVALLGGVYDVATLLLLLVLSVVMHTLGLIMDVRGKGKRAVDHALVWTMGVIGLVSVVTIAIYAISTYVNGGTDLPGYVYGVFVSMAVACVAFAANAYLQRVGRGKWANYIFGERMFMIISLAAKTALAWQIFGGLLHP